jgi:hypothetical protein
VQGQGRSATDGYKNFVISGNYIVGNGIKLGDTYINNCIISDNVIVDNDGTKYGILIQNTASYTNIFIHDNNLISEEDGDTNSRFIQSECILNRRCVISNNTFNGTLVDYYYYYDTQFRYYNGYYTGAKKVFGTTNNILTAAAGDWSNSAWHILGTVDGNNNLVGGTSGILAEQMVAFTRKPAYVTIYFRFKKADGGVPDVLNYQLRFRNSNNALLGSIGQTITSFAGNDNDDYIDFTARLVVSSLRLTGTPAKMGVYFAATQGEAYNFQQVLIAVSDQPPILQS